MTLAAALTSLHRRWPDFTDDEAGYEAQRVLFDRVHDVTGSAPAVVDSDVLCTHPDRVIAQWCERVGIDHRPESLDWEAGMQPEWQLWRSWYENAARSTGFRAPATGSEPDGDLPARVAELLPAAERAVRTLPRRARPARLTIAPAGATAACTQRRRTSSTNVVHTAMMPASTWLPLSRRLTSTVGLHTTVSLRTS